MVGEQIKSMLKPVNEKVAKSTLQMSKIEEKLQDLVFSLLESKEDSGK